MEKMAILVVNLLLIISVMSSSHNFRKNLTMFELINQDSVNSMIGLTQRKLETDNYIVLYFEQDCSYSSGFVNGYRNDIDFIINKNKKYTKEEPFDVTKDYGIEIHFNKAINSLNSFFNEYNDGNMLYLMSVDFTNFNSISITEMGNMFELCVSLKSVDLSNFDTSKVVDMRNMF